MSLITSVLLLSEPSHTERIFFSDINWTVTSFIPVKEKLKRRDWELNNSFSKSCVHIAI